MYTLDVLDTAGQVDYLSLKLTMKEEYTEMRKEYMNRGDGFLIAYSVTNRKSFEEAYRLRQLIVRRRGEDVRLKLV